MEPPSPHSVRHEAHSEPIVVPPITSLGVLDPASASHRFLTPVKKINDGADVSHFLTSKAYRDIGLFIMQLNRSLCPRKTASGPSRTFPIIGAKREDPESVRRIQALLGQVESYIEEAPPQDGPRRFGNASFRTWYDLVVSRTDALLEDHVQKQVLQFRGADAEGASDDRATAMDEIKAYFLGSFGSAQRLDYGTGHELSFLAFLGCLWKLGAFPGDVKDGELERSIVLGIIESYLKVIRKLILTYTLEPAGSHGVWGLDDHSFLPYIFGSAQLTRPISGTDAMPLEGSVERAPRPGDIVKAEAVKRLRDTNMYFSAVGFINDVKKGPFWEHSPILFDVSGIRDGWGKINKGMIKMYNAEVLSKFPVVQHFPFGSLFSWEQDPSAMAAAQSVHVAMQPRGNAQPSAMPTNLGMPAPGAAVAGTRAPWASAAKPLAPPSTTRHHTSRPP